MAEVTEEVTTTEEATTKEATTEEVGLSVTDLVILKNLIDLTSQRGAIRPQEMILVGEVYSKLNAFLTAAGVLTTPEASTETAEEDPTGE